MAKYDHGGGCPCGLQKVCDCEVLQEPVKKYKETFSAVSVVKEILNNKNKKE